MADDRVRICTEHGCRVEAYSSGHWLCPSKTGPMGHKQHLVVEAETNLVDGTRFSTVPGAPPPRVQAAPAAPSPKPTEAVPSVKTVVRWKGRSGERVIWLHALSGKRRSGDPFVLRWAILTGKKTEQASWATAPDEQAARREFDAQVARSKAAGWKEDTIGGQIGRLVLKPVPGPAEKTPKGKADRG